VTASYNLFVVPILKLMYLTLQRPGGKGASTDGLFHCSYKVISTLRHKKNSIPYLKHAVERNGSVCRMTYPFCNTVPMPTDHTEILVGLSFET